MFRVYIIQNHCNNKAYIGYTGRSPEARFRAHKSCARNKPQFRFHFAINKYGEENFYVNLLEDNIETEEKAKERETYWIKLFKSDTEGYNATSGGTGGWMIGRLSEEKQKEWVSKITEATTGENNPRFCGLDNDTFFKLLVDKCRELGYITSYNILAKLIRCDGHSTFPLSLSSYRGRRDEIRDKLVSMTGLSVKLNVRTENHRRKLSTAFKGKIWINNGITSKQIKKEDMDKYEGFVPGRLKKNGNQN
jgi:group I intron endonuclease